MELQEKPEPGSASAPGVGAEAARGGVKGEVRTGQHQGTHGARVWPHRRGLPDTGDVREELALAALEGPSLGARSSCRRPGRSPGAAVTMGEAPPPQRCLASAFPSPPDSLVLNPNPKPDSK